MNSALYVCNVMHHRLAPKKNRFAYEIFMLALDLDEIDVVSKGLRFFSRNRFNLFDFRDQDHLEMSGRSVKDHILDYAAARGTDLSKARITLVTHVRFLGYIFNPVCFYFCSDANGAPLCAIVEVENTYHEKKRYWLGPETLEKDVFHHRVPKFFYVSPYVDLDAEFEFKLTPPGESLAVYIDDWKEGRKFLLTSLTGERQRLNDARLLWNTLRFPFVTLKVIFLIHWQALILKLKGLPHIRKSADPHLQQEVYHVRHRS